MTEAVISDALWTDETPTIGAHWETEFHITIAFDTDELCLNRAEATRLRDALNEFLKTNEL